VAPNGVGEVRDRVSPVVDACRELAILERALGKVIVDCSFG
jgi:hypothetical protein